MLVLPERGLKINFKDRRHQINISTRAVVIMFKVGAILASLLASAVAFAPTSRMSSRNALKMAFDEETSGVLPPVGYWDPLGT